jgi:peptide/nickel transport system permease protein
MSTQHTSSRFWKRFKKNKLALISFIYIVLVLLIAVFAYPLSPDGFENANTMTVELATKPPGFSTLVFKKPTHNTSVSYLHSFFLGTEKKYDIYPIKSCEVGRDSIVMQHVLDDELQERLAFSKLDIHQKEISDEAFYKKYVTQKTYWLGTDKYGRDMLSRLIIGSRVSMAVGIIAVFISIIIGVLLGMLAGYFGGIADGVITWIINVLWAIPTMLLVFAITFVLGKGFWIIFIAVGFTMWVGTARLIRGQVMSLKELEYIQAARVMGYSHMRIIFKHILPNVLGPTIVMAASNFATAILIEAGLSFLGIGVQPPVPSWGLMIKENYNFIITNKPLLAIIPGIAIMLIVLAFNLLGNALRDALDVKSV